MIGLSKGNQERKVGQSKDSILTGNYGRGKMSFASLLSAISMSILLLFVGLHHKGSGNIISFPEVEATERIMLSPENANPTHSTTLSSKKVNPTPYMMFLWGTAQIKGSDVVPGDRIDAFAPQVSKRIGTFTVWYPGYYGALAVYGDDPTTPEKDGAAENDPIILTIKSATTRRIYLAYPVSSDNPVFHNLSVQEVNLCTK